MPVMVFLKPELTNQSFIRINAYALQALKRGLLVPVLVSEYEINGVTWESLSSSCAKVCGLWGFVFRGGGADEDFITETGRLLVIRKVQISVGDVCVKFHSMYQ